MADVREAVDERTGQTVAVKLLRSLDETDIRRFDRELEALRAVEHPGIVGILDAGVHGGTPYLVLEYIEGGTLEQTLDAGPIGPERAAVIGAELARALAAAHAQGVTHRDVKPANVLLEADGRPRLADFGVARLAGASTLTVTGFTIGTATYLAPEQVRGEVSGPPADIYSLGLLVLEAATGERAFEGAGTEAALARLVQDPYIPESLPAPFAEVIRSVTAADPADRPSAAVAGRRFAELARGDDGDTALFPIASTETGLLAVVPAAAPAVPPTRGEGAPLPEPVVAPAVPPTHSWVRSLAFAALCLLAGFLAVSAVRALADTGSALEVPASTTATTATTVPPTTVPPTTAPPPTEPPRRDRDRDNGRGHDD